MKKFLYVSILFALPIFLSLIITELLLRQIPNDYSYKKNYLDAHSNEIELLYLGSSHVYYGLNPEYSKFNSFNASHISQSINFDFAILEKYKNKWSNLRCVIIPIDYFSMYSTLEGGIEKWRVKNYSIYYEINNSSRFSTNFEVLNGPFKTNFGRLKSHFYKNSTDITCNKLGWGKNYNSKDPQDLIQTGKAASKRHTIENNDNLCFDNNIKTINSIIKFAKNNKVKLIFFTSPAYKTYSENLEQKQLNNTINAISQKANKNLNIFYYNLLNDETFTAEDFYDADHLNEKGAMKLTLKIDSLIIKN